MQCSIILKPAGYKPEDSIELGVLHSSNYHVHAVWILIDQFVRVLDICYKSPPSEFCAILL